MQVLTEENHASTGVIAAHADVVQAPVVARSDNAVLVDSVMSNAVVDIIASVVWLGIGWRVVAALGLILSSRLLCGRCRLYARLKASSKAFKASRSAADGRLGVP